MKEIEFNQTKMRGRVQKKIKKNKIKHTKESENCSEIKRVDRALGGANQRSMTRKKESELDSARPTELKPKRKTVVRERKNEKRI